MGTLPRSNLSLWRRENSMDANIEVGRLGMKYVINTNIDEGLTFRVSESMHTKRSNFWP